MSAACSSRPRRTGGGYPRLRELCRQKNRLFVYLVSTKYEFFSVVNVCEHAGVPKSFVFDGELARRDDGKWVFQAFDTLLVQNRTVGKRTLLNRVKLVAPLLPFLASVFSRKDVRVQIKPYYDLQSLVFVAGMLKDRVAYPFPTDGLVFTAAGTGGASFKWKPLQDQTVDFRVGENCVDLFTNDGDGPQGTLDSTGTPNAIVECRYVDGGVWTAVRARGDKHNPNGQRVFERTMAVIKDHITEEDLGLAAHQARRRVQVPRAAATVKKTYADPKTFAAHAKEPAGKLASKPVEKPASRAAGQPADRTADRTAYFSDVRSTGREKSDNRAMKGFHNSVVKEALYKRFIGCSVVDLACGRGSDCRRAYKHGTAEGTHTYCAVDADAAAVKEAQRRWTQVERAEKHALRARTEFAVVDLTDPAQTEPFFPRAQVRHRHVPFCRALRAEELAVRAGGLSGGGRVLCRDALRRRARRRAGPAGRHDHGIQDERQGPDQDPPHQLRQDRCLD